MSSEDNVKSTQEAGNWVEAHKVLEYIKMMCRRALAIYVTYQKYQQDWIATGNEP